MSACGRCHGVNCSNQSQMAEDTSESSNEEYNDGNIFENLFE
jgi:hypothetical protein